MYVKHVTKLGILVILDKPNQGRMGHDGYPTIYIYYVFTIYVPTITFI